MRVSYAIAVILAIVAAAPTVIDISAHGLPCSGNCSGQPAGYAFARRHQVSLETECRAGSDQFWQGCVDYMAKKST